MCIWLRAGVTLEEPMCIWLRACATLEEPMCIWLRSCATFDGLMCIWPRACATFECSECVKLCLFERYGEGGGERVLHFSHMLADAARCSLLLADAAVC